MSVILPPHNQSSSFRLGKPLYPCAPVPWQPAQFSLKAARPPFRANSVSCGSFWISSKLLWEIFSKNYFSGLFNLNGDTSTITFNVSSIIFWLSCIIFSVITLFKNWSLIPLLGLVTCLYLLTGMTAMNWAWFGGWLVLGLVVYFMYGYKKSKLA